MGSQIVSHEEVLNVVCASGGPLTASEVAEELAVSVSTARRYLADLIDRGWITRGQVTRIDQPKRVRFYPTPRGTEANTTREGY